MGDDFDEKEFFKDFEAAGEGPVPTDEPTIVGKGADGMSFNDLNIEIVGKNGEVRPAPKQPGAGPAPKQADARGGKIGPGENVLFWHTGGTTALFAEPEILGHVI